ncbi:DUF4258 domain-containing protein [Bradyrhizobium cenepequi]
MKKPLTLTAHARIRLQERHIDPKWIEEAVANPDWTQADPRDPTVKRRFKILPQFGGRVLRVACVETISSIRIISAMFDRNARRTP